MKTLNLLKVNVRIVSEGQDGEKVDYIQVLGTTRSLVHSEERKAQDRIVEVGVKASISSSKGEEPAPVNEVPEFKGGANFVEAAVNEVPEYTGILATVGDQAVPSVEKPEFKGGVNAVMALEHKLPEYRGILATVGNQPAPTVENQSLN